MTAREAANRVLEVRDLSASWTGKRISGYDKNRPVTFGLDAGEWLLVAGVNGVGKSTLLHALAGETPFSRGEISVNGRLLHLGRPRDRKWAGVYLVPQISRWPDSLQFADAVDLVSHGTERIQEEDARTCERRFAEAGLLEEGGLLTPRVFDLICGMLERPHLLILDEVGPIWRRYELNPARERRALYDLIRELLPETAVVFTEHATPTALAVSTRVLWLRDDYPPSELHAGDERATSELQASLAGDPPPPVESDSEARAPWRLVMRPEQSVREQVRLAICARRATARHIAQPYQIEKDFEFLREERPATSLSGGQQTVLRWFLLNYTGLGKLPSGLIRHLDGKNRERIERWGQEASLDPGTGVATD